MPTRLRYAIIALPLIFAALGIPYRQIEYPSGASRGTFVRSAFEASPEDYTNPYHGTGFRYNLDTGAYARRIVLGLVASGVLALLLMKRPVDTKTPNTPHSGLQV